MSAYKDEKPVSTLRDLRNLYHSERNYDRDLKQYKNKPQYDNQKIVIGSRNASYFRISYCYIVEEYCKNHPEKKKGYKILHSSLNIMNDRPIYITGKET